MSRISFEEKSTLGISWFLEVRDGRHLIGHIYRGGNTGSYQYHHGPFNQLTSEFSDTDLERLKKKVMGKYER